ncbi:nucleotidyltransferase substrate binding protein [Methanolobus zinderi]|jgi:nucleotidyltransferase substrate binding protein (TIGR01987 family)|uniref:Nucleotidyltransferase substrate binding protein n=1 Tax=Methanolobus zinderi TaxID=536044 RepID=A0A7D5HZF3_9EURY|nr:HI0074 family nucleotidyltransferase substrate-binding subunit [Methanolobus zinderi]KXS43392.1 MAG: nucleotidyltransferase substrate binding protein [Methanolobus sp. T82-4]QLC48906.1 nucleotidyltransferase substrate binding protein [Methanolobus zinderi]
MEKLEMILGDARRALATLEEVLDEPFSLIVRDASIQRFEYTFEVTWKLIRQYLKDREGIVCNSPKSCFREAFKVDLVTEEETVKALQMTDDRNMTTHTYREEVADEIYGNLPGYYDLMYNITTGISERMN